VLGVVGNIAATGYYALLKASWLSPESGGVDEAAHVFAECGRLYEAMRAEAIAADEKSIESERGEMKLHQ
jgi:hypothetical protein